ncbi:MAG: hypothetical protein JSW58_16905 [Candidatus Latescibacterota bacterium]|nr:MAG: hypothetical protein JSW58_16905 [Candidatus Latescibacterota bacterium]
MRKLVLVATVFCVAVFLISCGEKEQDEPQQTAQADQDTSGWQRPVHWPKGKDVGRLQGVVLDTLRAKKKRFSITRDQYWQNEGGVLANDFFEVWYPPGRMTVTHGMYVFEELMPARKKLKSFFGEAPEELFVINCSIDLEVYKKRTGREWWYYSEIKGDTATFGPIFILSKRGISSMAIPHEYYQWAVQKLTRYGAPRWLEEGLASYLSDEAELLLNQMYEFRRGDVSMTPARIEDVLQGEVTRRDSRIAYYRCYRMVKKLIDTYGENKLREAVLLIGRGNTLDDAFRTVYSLDYDGILEVASDYKVDLTKKKS